MKTLEEWQIVVVEGEGDDAVYPWAFDMELLWRRGAKGFMKCPVQLRVDSDPAIVTKKPNAEDRRPLRCPEPPPAGTKFALAWWDGLAWRAEEVLFCEDPEDQTVASARKLYQDLSSYQRSRNLEVAKKQLAEACEADRFFAEELKLLSEKIRVNDEYRLAGPKVGQSLCLPIIGSHPINNDDIAEVFAAGVRRGIQKILREVGIDPRIAEAGAEESFGHWREIVQEAANRHDINLTPELLVEKMGGKKVDRGTRSTANHYFEWDNGDSIPAVNFRKFHALWRDKNPKLKN